MSEGIRVVEKRIADLKAQLKQVRQLYNRMNYKVQNSPEHGGKGKDSIEGQAKGSDALNLLFDNTQDNPRNCVQRAKEEIDRLTTSIEGSEK